jgi:hypothetical protein
MFRPAADSAMKRFEEGDLAITCNSRAPLINDGHLVTILEVIGPDPKWGLEFGYFIERVDGLPFALSRRKDSPMPAPGAHILRADQFQLRPLRRLAMDAHTPRTATVEV